MHKSPVTIVSDGYRITNKHEYIEYIRIYAAVNNMHIAHDSGNLTTRNSPETQIQTVHVGHSTFIHGKKN